MGDGSQIKICEVKWLLNQSSFAVQAPIQRLGREARVKKKKKKTY